MSKEAEEVKFIR